MQKVPLLERDETGRVRSTNTRPSVLDGVAISMLALHPTNTSHIDNVTH